MFCGYHIFLNSDLRLKPWSVVIIWNSDLAVKIGYWMFSATTRFVRTPDFPLLYVLYIVLYCPVQCTLLCTACTALYTSGSRILFLVFPALPPCSPMTGSFPIWHPIGGNVPTWTWGRLHYSIKWFCYTWIVSCFQEIYWRWSI